MTELCGAKTKSKAGTCQHVAGHGTDHVGVGRCRLHGGASPMAQASGALQLANLEAHALGAPMQVGASDLPDMLLQLIGNTAGWYRYCQDRVDELAEIDAAGPVTLTHERPMKGEYGMDLHDIAVETRRAAPQLHIWIQARDQAGDRLAGYIKTALALGIAERHVRLAEQQAELVADAMKAFATAMGHNPADPQVRQAMRQGLMVIAGGAA